ncbi:MAG: peptidase S16 [Gammaproteobacteria bacterium]|nr:peptidase S16 [Gammaproteobacteria bacterium]
MRESELAIFPLNTVLFPGGPLTLRIFETRYIDMISRCLKDKSGFGVVAIENGTEAGKESSATTTYDVGTLAEIGDWYTEKDGLLGIVVVGTKRFRIESTRIQRDGLHVAQVNYLEAEDTLPVPDDFSYMAALMESIIDQLGKQYELVDRNYTDATWLSYRLAEILPLNLRDRQRCLQSNDTLERLASLAPVLNALSVEDSDEE